jgi:hypothetical protein
MSNTYTFKRLQSELITIGMDVRKPQQIARIPIEEGIRFIRNGRIGKKDIRELILRIRCTHDAEKRRALKDKLPWISGALFSGKRCLKDVLQNNKMILDGDHILKPEDVKKQAIEVLHPSISKAFRSPYDGIKFVYELAEPIMDDITYHRVYQYLASDLRSKLGVEADENAKNRAQACYLSWDNDIAENLNCEPLDVASIPNPHSKPGPAQIIYFPGEWQGKERASAANSAPGASSPVYKGGSKPIPWSGNYQRDYDTAVNIVDFMVSKGRFLRGEWIKTAYALKARFGDAGRDIFLHYADNQAYDEDTIAKLARIWDRLDEPKFVSFASLIWVAQKHGWKHDRYR